MGAEADIYSMAASYYFSIIASTSFSYDSKWPY